MPIQTRKSRAWNRRISTLSLVIAQHRAYHQSVNSSLYSQRVVSNWIQIRILKSLCGGYVASASNIYRSSHRRRDVPMCVSWHVIDFPFGGARTIQADKTKKVECGKRKSQLVIRDSKRIRNRIGPGYWLIKLIITNHTLIHFKLWYVII